MRAAASWASPDSPTTTMSPLGLQQRAQALPDDLVVIEQEDPDGRGSVGHGVCLAPSPRGEVDDLVDVLEPDRFVGDPDDRPVTATRQHLGGQLLGGGVVEMGRRLVQDEHPLVGQQRPGHGQTRTLAARDGRRAVPEAGGETVGEPVQPDPRDRPRAERRRPPRRRRPGGRGGCSRRRSSRRRAGRRRPGRPYGVRRRGPGGAGRPRRGGPSPSRGPRSAAAARRACSCPSRRGRRRRSGDRWAPTGTGRPGPGGRPSRPSRRATSTSVSSGAATGVRGGTTAGGERQQRVEAVLGGLRPGRGGAGVDDGDDDLGERQRQQHEQGGDRRRQVARRHLRARR